MIHFQKSHWLTILIGIILILLAGVIYTFTSLSSIKNHNTVLQKQITEVKSDQMAEVDTTKLQNDLANLVLKVPVEKLVDAIVLDLENAAIGADSIILNASFADVEKEELTEEELSPEEQLVEELQSTEGDLQPTEEDLQSSEEQVLEKIKVTVPDGLEAITISLTVLSKDYEALTTFLENIRMNTRIYVVESFSFQGFEEGEVLPGPQEDHLEYNVVLLTYYAPIITEVANKFGLVIPPASNKDNPVYDVLEEKEKSQADMEPKEEHQVDGVEETQPEEVEKHAKEKVVTPAQPKSTKSTVRTYVVQPNDTLYSISMKYYQSRKGESLIKKANKRNTDIVIIGETLVIPE
ncbi:LysM peptidoglycan-binding domain-containing protein [Psychrobacillus sp. OK032]|uniref:LysM peptidoglycan-binding domain-containing protein n=1 Tax=Psychrobacillus sp. OK032 TaxID=1884358 RepID=UPI0008BEB22E|nr:LysM peptidoglycan-binding domain-containing protein [Psychrobacillus sp. OK032]SER85576.1 LysM repeat-containing protein [Psychrobacillus sp. OK032]